MSFSAQKGNYIGIDYGVQGDRLITQSEILVLQLSQIYYICNVI